MSILNNPRFTQIDEHGHIEVEFPDPPRRTYEISHELVVELAKERNRVADLREQLTRRRWIACSKAIRLLDGSVNAERSGEGTP